MNRFEKIDSVFEEMMKESEEEIIQIQNDEEYSEDEKKSEIKEFKEKMTEILKDYEKIMKMNYKPSLKFNLMLVYKCYLIDCPRHSEL